MGGSLGGGNFTNGRYHIGGLIHIKKPQRNWVKTSFQAQKKRGGGNQRRISIYIGAGILKESGKDLAKVMREKYPS